MMRRRLAAVAFHMSRNRWCGNIGRAHKSNHVVWHADLLHGVAYQTCMDPDCRARGYRSVNVQIPLAVLAAHRDVLPPSSVAKLDAAAARMEHASSNASSSAGGARGY